jgi:hypothetical protein
VLLSGCSGLPGSGYVNDLVSAAEEKRSKENNASIEGVSVIESEQGAYFDITYATFVKSLGKEMAYAAGYSSTNDVSEVIDKAKEITVKADSIDEYGCEVNSRELIFDYYEISGYPFPTLKMLVYSDSISDKIIKVYVSKSNRSDLPYEESSNLMTRFNSLANGASKLLSGKQVSELQDYEYWTEDDVGFQTNHYIKYNECEMRFHEVAAVISDERSLTIYPANSSEIVNNNTSNEKVEEDDEEETENEPKYIMVPTDDELTEAFNKSIFHHDFYGWDAIDIQVDEMIDMCMVDYSVTFYNLQEAFDKNLFVYYEIEDWYMDYPNTYIAALSGNVASGPYSSRIEYYADPAYVTALVFDEEGEFLYNVNFERVGDWIDYDLMIHYGYMDDPND